ncbi:serine/threonine protein kinase [Vibrio sp. OPT10]|uniref:serine/threonine protein kinase n=1 Tax=Vibrio sp. OPT10 TaxID=2778640 RepID=UPI00187DEFB9|nr:protein kinase [Vibrio sp. OPT10]MBE8606936.1 protein kinase [Vibrio sp. OPT10]
MLEDSQSLRLFIAEILPSFRIDNVVKKKSGQRVVYFGAVDKPSDDLPIDSNQWGEVVLKISEMNTRSAIAYVQKETEILSQLNSSSYPKSLYGEVITHDPFTEEALSPLIYISIEERIQGVPLTEIIHHYNTTPKVIDFLLQCTNSLKSLWLHPQKLIHRDLKPDNILIKNDSSISIIDLGLLREQGDKGVTNSFAAFGPCTPSYGSPEQILNEKRNISFKSDMFSLGIIAYEMLSGYHPFIELNGSNLIDEIFERVCSHDPEHLSTKGIPLDLANTIEKMISKEPYRRHRTPQLLINELLSIKE